MRRRIDVKSNGSGSTSPDLCKRTDSASDVYIDDSGCHPTLRCENILVRSGVRMMIADQPMQAAGRRIRIDYEIDRAPISFSYSLSERVRCTVRHGLRSPTVAERVPGDGVLAYLPQTRGNVEIFPDRRISGVSLHFSVHAFKSLFPSLPPCLEHLDAGPGGPSATKPVFQQSRFGEETFNILSQILQCSYAGDLRRLFFEAKALELAALKMAEWGRKEDTAPSALSRRDIDRVREAYYILSTRLDHPPGLVDLGRIVGLNRNKLNRGFKTLFGDTAFNLLRNARLSKARSLLDNTDLSLSEIALAVGYNSQSNFTTAFRKHYGKTPKAVRRVEGDDPAFFP